MPRRAWWVLLAVLVVIFGVTTWIAGQRAEPVPSGVQRLGPEAGEPVAGYLRRAGASLPAGASSHLGLVQPGSHPPPHPAAQLTRGGRLSPGAVPGPLPRPQNPPITP